MDDEHTFRFDDTRTSGSNWIGNRLRRSADTHAHSFAHTRTLANISAANSNPHRANSNRDASRGNGNSRAANRHIAPANAHTRTNLSGAGSNCRTNRASCVAADWHNRVPSKSGWCGSLVPCESD